MLLAATNRAGAAPSPVMNKPSLLWRTYPLVQRTPSPAYRSYAFAAGNLPLPLQAQPGGSGAPSQTLLLLLLASVTTAAAGLLIVRSAFPNATRDEATPQQPSKSDSMDLLVALRPENVLRRPEVEGHSEPGSRDRTGSAPVLRALPPPEEPRPTAGIETSKVVLWRGSMKYQLYVASLAEDAGWRPLAVSPFFGLSDEDVPTEQASTALRMLVAQLEREGWKVSCDGTRWYELELERPRD